MIDRNRRTNARRSVVDAAQEPAVEVLSCDLLRK